MRAIVAVLAVLLGSLALTAVLPSGPATAQGAPDLSALDDAARDAFNAGEMPGAVILVGQGDRVLYRKAFGMRS